MKLALGVGLMLAIVLSPIVVGGWRYATDAQMLRSVRQWADETCQRRGSGSYEAWIATTHDAVRTADYPRRTIRLQC